MGFTLTVSSLLDSWIMSRMNRSWMNELRYCVELVGIPSSPHQNLQMLPRIEIVTSSEEHLGDILDSCPLQYLIKLMNITLWNNLKKIKQKQLLFLKSNLHLLFIFHQTATQFPPQTEPTPTHNRSSLPIECEVIVWEVYKHTHLNKDAAINHCQHEYSSTDGQTSPPPPWHCNLVFDWN